jgi:toxin HigB-1
MIIPTALCKLDVLAGAHSLVDLRAPPGNRLELLKGEWRGCYSIRINDPWRIVFRWETGNATQVALIDYHS